MILDKTVKTRWANPTKKYYEALGYVFTGKNDELEVKVEHLKSNSSVSVRVRCDKCGKVTTLKFAELFKKSGSCSSC